MNKKAIVLLSGGLDSSLAVKIMLQQHIGTPAGPAVKEGQKIKKGGMVGDVPADRLGVPVHASISGTISGVTDQYVEIINREK